MHAFFVLIHSCRIGPEIMAVLYVPVANHRSNLMKCELIEIKYCTKYDLFLNLYGD